MGTLSKGSVKVITNGVLFERAKVEGVLNAAIARGTKDLLPVVEDAVTRKLDSSLKAPTGKFRSSIGGQVYPTGTGVIRSTDNRRIKTWIERRTRGGQRLGSGAYAFEAGKRLAKTVNKAGFYEHYIAEELNK